MGEGEAVLGPKPSHQLAEHHAQLAGHQRDVDGGGHSAEIILGMTGNLHSLPVWFRE